MNDRPTQAAAPPALLDDVALLALVVAHGTDGTLHRDEVGALLDRLRALETDFGGDAEASLQRAAGRYDRVAVERLDAMAARVAHGLDADARSRVFAALVAVAEADGVVHPMEATLLRHLAHAWGVANWPADGALAFSVQASASAG